MHTDRQTERDFNASISGECCASSPGMWCTSSKTEHTLLRCDIASYPAIDAECMMTAARWWTRQCD